MAVWIQCLKEWSLGFRVEGSRPYLLRMWERQKQIACSEQEGQELLTLHLCALLTSRCVVSKLCCATMPTGAMDATALRLRAVATKQAKH